MDPLKHSEILKKLELPDLSVLTPSGKGGGGPTPQMWFPFTHSGQVPCRPTSDRGRHTNSDSEAGSGQDYPQTGTICEPHIPGGKERRVPPPSNKFEANSRWKEWECSEIC